MLGWYNRRRRCHLNRGLLISFFTELHACSFWISRTWNDILCRTFFWDTRKKEWKEYSETKQRKWNLILIYFLWPALLLGIFKVDFCVDDEFARICRMAKQTNQVTLPKRLIRFQMLTIRNYSLNIRINHKSSELYSSSSETCLSAISRVFSSISKLIKKLVENRSN